MFDGPSSSRAVQSHDDVLKPMQAIEGCPSNFVEIAFINMQWGKELLETPCGSPIERAIHAVVPTEGENRHFLCDFGEDFGADFSLQESSKKDY